MTFLEIVQAAFRDSGIAGSTGPSTVLDQVGRNADFVRWAKEAYEDIQNDRKEWKFSGYWRISLGARAFRASACRAGCGRARC
jgi:hypothetical protein